MLLDLNIPYHKLNNINWNKKITYYLLSCAILFLFTLLIIGFFYYNDLKKEQAIIAEQVEAHIKEQKALISDYFISIVVSDLMYLAEDEDLLANSNSMKQKIAAKWKRFAAERKIYDQIRFLDTTGQERIRINYNQGQPTIVPPDQLQYKGERYYFEDTLKLNNRSVYVSPFDLNIEQGQLVRPLKPMIRFGTPVFNNQQEKIGVVILNYFGQDLINKIKKQATGNREEFMLLNSDSYWLYASNPTKSWGFMFKERQQINFKNQFPQVWAKISAKESGQLRTDQGLFVFNTVYPLRESWQTSTGSTTPFGSSDRWLTADEYYWKLVSYVPRDTFNKQSLSLIKKHFRSLLLLGIILLFINLPLTKLLLERRAAEEKLKQNENYYKSLFKGNNMVTLLIEPKTGYIRDANATVLAFYGYSKQELTNKKITGLMYYRSQKYLRK